MADEEEPPWASLPPELKELCLASLCLCLASLPGNAKQKALATCRAFGRALTNGDDKARMVLDVDRSEPFAPSARLLQSLAPGNTEAAEGEQQQQSGVTLELFSKTQGSPGRCLTQLRARGVPALACITRLELKGLSLDALIPDGLEVVLPNLQRLHISECELTDAAEYSFVNAACTKLQHLELKALDDPSDLLWCQLLQLEGLPAFTSVHLLDDSVDTHFFEALGTRLTSLHLGDAYGKTPTYEWRATLQRVARCTQLQSLAIPCMTHEELALVAPALQQLRRLHLNSSFTVPSNGDVMMEQLLGLPHLTSLQWDSPNGHTFTRSYQQHPCPWKELNLKLITPHQLSHLPLHSLTSPVYWQVLLVTPETSVAEVQAAAANVARFGAVGHTDGFLPTLHFKPSPGHATFTHGATATDTPATLLRAMQPLLASSGLVELSIKDLAWYVQLVKLLGEVLPRTCVKLSLNNGTLPEAAAAQLGRSLPWLERVLFKDMSLEVLSARAFISGAVEGERRRLERVEVSRPECPAGVSETIHKMAWRSVQRHALALGVQLDLV